MERLPVSPVMVEDLEDVEGQILSKVFTRELEQELGGNEAVAHRAAAGRVYVVRRGL